MYRKVENFKNQDGYDRMCYTGYRTIIVQADIHSLFKPSTGSIDECDIKPVLLYLSGHMKQNNSKSKSSILQASFCLFLTENYEKVTVREIEKQTKLTRGAIFYYFKDKQDLFEAIVKEIYFAEMSQHPSIPLGSFNVLDFLNYNYKSPCDRLISKIKSLNINVNAQKAFFHFTLQASIYYPNFDIIYCDIMHEESIFIEKLLSNMPNTISKNDLKDIIHLLLDYNYGNAFNSILSFSSMKLPVFSYLNLQK